MFTACGWAVIVAECDGVAAAADGVAEADTLGLGEPLESEDAEGVDVPQAETARTAAIGRSNGARHRLMSR